MPTFVLVHGAWHGGECWTRVARRLREAGARVFTPSLTGLGDRASSAVPTVGVTRHVRDLVELAEGERLQDVILVGHSYAGLVITGAAERCAPRLARLVYLDAVGPGDGDSLLALGSDVLRAIVADAAATHPWLVPAPPPDHYGVRDPDDAAWLAPQLRPMPLACFAQPLEAPTHAAERVARTVVWCVRPGERLSIPRSAIDIRVIDAAHDAMVTDPAEVSRVLLDTARLPTGPTTS